MVTISNASQGDKVTTHGPLNEWPAAAAPHSPHYSAVMAPAMPDDGHDR